MIVAVVELRATGYDLVPAGEGERILGAAITERLTLTSCDIFEALTAGSTKAFAEVRRHSAIVKVQRYTITME